MYANPFGIRHMIFRIEIDLGLFEQLALARRQVVVINTWRSVEARERVKRRVVLSLSAESTRGANARELDDDLLERTGTRETNDEAGRPHHGEERRGNSP